MLICPECQTENYESNKFCEQCGTSLVEKNCPSCNGKVSYNDLQCPHCGAVIANVYQCIVACPKNKPLSIPASFLTHSSEDSSARYILADGIVPEELKPFTSTDEVDIYSFRVFDRQPLQKSFLDITLETVSGFDRQSLRDGGVPPLAFPYLTLAEYGAIIPELFDAWRCADTQQEIVIIPQRETWHSLRKCWQDRNLDTTTVFAHLKKMAKLWKSFIKVKCCNTLLHIDNIGVDKEKNLQLEKIYLDSADNPPLLREMLQLWCNFLEKHQRQELPLITQLIVDVEEGTIENIRDLRSSLDQLAEQAKQGNFSIVSEDKSEGEIVNIPAEEELNKIAEQFDLDDEDEEDATVASDNDENGENIDDQPTVVLPMRLLSLGEAGLTDIGRRRGHNEDFFAIHTKINKQETPQGTFCQVKGFFVVCDGMGGHSAGEVASSMAVRHLYKHFEQHWQDSFPDSEMIENAILDTNKEIYSANMDKGNIGSGRMGTTLVMAIVEGTKLGIAHVGDSRIYRVTRKWGLEQLTADHSVANAEIQNGVDPELAFARPDAFQLTQALGPRDNNFVHPDIDFIDIKEDTLIVMCSDGLSDNQLIENNWQSHFLPLISSKANLEEGVLQAIDFGNQINGHDNITCILIRIKVQPDLESQSPI